MASNSDVGSLPVSFRGQGFSNRARLVNPPKIIVSKLAMDKMEAIVGVCPTEVCWQGFVVEIPGGNFLLKDIYLLKQEVSAVHATPTADGFSELQEQLLALGAAGEEIIAGLRFDGHSHVHMDNNFSSIDEKLLQRVVKAGFSWYIFGVFNKKGQARFDLLLRLDSRPLYLIIEEVEWDDERCQVPAQLLLDVAQELAEKVKQAAIPSSVQHECRQEGFQVAPVSPSSPRRQRLYSNVGDRIHSPNGFLGQPTVKGDGNNEHAHPHD